MKDAVRAPQAAPSTAKAPSPAPTTAAARREELRAATYQQGRSMLQPPPAAAAALEGLTPSQRRYVEVLQAVEAANPKAKPADLAMALSLLLWEGRIWERDGKAADVTRPAGVPLVLDYKGGDGYKNVTMTREQEQFFEQQRNVSDQGGVQSGVAHAFPAVASMAGREGSASGAYNARMVTSIGDFIQDVARVLVERKFQGVFRDAEMRDNNRALKMAVDVGKSGRALSAALIERFREENREPARTAAR